MVPATPLWKRAAILGGVLAGTQVIHHRSHQVGTAMRNGQPPPMVARYAPVLSRVGELLQLDSRLAFVVDVVPHPEDGGHGIEEPARAGGQRGVTPVRASWMTSSQRGPFLRTTSRSSGAPPSWAAAEKCRRHAPRLPDGCRASRHRHRLEVANPFEADEVGHEQLAPQMVPSVP